MAVENGGHEHQHGPLTSGHDLQDPHEKSHITATQERPETSITLADVKVGAQCSIVTVGGEGALRRRLLDMGLTPKTKVKVRSVAPLGDPMELMLRGYSLSLRKEDAARILVTPLGE